MLFICDAQCVIAAFFSFPGECTVQVIISWKKKVFRTHAKEKPHKEGRTAAGQVPMVMILLLICPLLANMNSTSTFRILNYVNRTVFRVFI